ncbi:MAG: hypothetical protein WC718_06085 [Phycisphaerales bacterium]|jgi:hypothetical protein
MSRPRTLSAASDPPQTARCPSCGYSLAQIQALTCPECGARWTETRADHEASMRMSPRSRRDFAVGGVGFLVAGLTIAYFTGVFPPRWISWILPVRPARGAALFWCGLGMLLLCWSVAGVYLRPAITGRRSGVAEDLHELIKRD